MPLNEKNVIHLFVSLSVYVSVFVFYVSFMFCLSSFFKSITKKMENLILLHIILVKLGDWDAANVFKEFKTFYLPVLEKHHKPKNIFFFFSLFLNLFFFSLFCCEPSWKEAQNENCFPNMVTAF